MERLKNLYQEYNGFWVKLLFPLILFLYPFVNVAQGVDVSDSTYSLSNYLFFERMEGMWVVSTYNSNVVGWLLTKLPLGDTLLGMNIYTTLLVSGTVLMAYFYMRKWMPAWIVFVGELIAVGFLWIPTGILYNYLSYFFFALGTLLLYQGLVEEKDGCLVAAGFSLGFNVFVRVSNLTEMALILALWYYLVNRKYKTEAILRKTLLCIGGYGAGVLLPLCLILGQYGTEGIISMLTGLRQVQGSVESYSLGGMVKAVLDAYARTFKWVLVILLGIAMGMAMVLLLKRRFLWLQHFLYYLGLALMIRLFWGRGMFSCRYYEDYSSMYEWGMIGLYLCLAAGVYMLCSRTCTLEEKLWACIALVIVVITPLGSNNYTFQNLNNLFLIAPFTLYTYVKLQRRRLSESREQIVFPIRAMVLMLGIMILIQSAGFHGQFVFRDGMDGQKRSYVFTEPGVVAGMRTTEANGVSLEGVLHFLEEENKDKREFILYGDCPGLSFLAATPVAIGSSWPDLDSYPYDTFVAELESLTKAPLVVLREGLAEGEQNRLKKEYLYTFIKKNQYEKVYDNGVYSVYQSRNEVLR